MDLSTVHYCAFCERVVIGFQDADTFPFSVQLLINFETAGAMSNCALFKLLTKGIPSTALDSSTTLHALVSCDDKRVTWTITLHIKYTSGGKVHYSHGNFFYIYTQKGKNLLIISRQCPYYPSQVTPRTTLYLEKCQILSSRPWRASKPPVGGS